MLRPKLVLLLTEIFQYPRAQETRRLLYLRDTGTWYEPLYNRLITGKSDKIIYYWIGIFD